MLQRASLAESDVHHLLSNPRRRETLTALLDSRGEVLSVRELSEAIATTESGEQPAPRPLRESVYNTLHQTHLPKLDSFGIVNYDADRKLVHPRPEAGQLHRYMDTVTPVGVTWGEYYRALGIFGLCAVVGSLAGLPGLGALDPLVFATAALTLFALSTVYQLYA
jgi:hypothetical protein